MGVLRMDGRLRSRLQILLCVFFVSVCACVCSVPTYFHSTDSQRSVYAAFLLCYVVSDSQSIY